MRKKRQKSRKKRAKPSAKSRGGFILFKDMKTTPPKQAKKPAAKIIKDVRKEVPKDPPKPPEAPKKQGFSLPFFRKSEKKEPVKPQEMPQMTIPAIPKMPKAKDADGRTSRFEDVTNKRFEQVNHSFEALKTMFMELKKENEELKKQHKEAVEKAEKEKEKEPEYKEIVHKREPVKEVSIPKLNAETPIAKLDKEMREESRGPHGKKEHAKKEEKHEDEKIPVMEQVREEPKPVPTSYVATQRTIETPLDSLLELVTKKGTIKINDAAKTFRVKDKQVEEWAKLLEEHGLIEIHYPTIGKPVLKKKAI